MMPANHRRRAGAAASLGLALLALPLQALAGFEIKTSALPPPAANPPPSAMIRGFGRQVPLELAIMQMVPSDIRFEIAADVDRLRPVDWQGGRDWLAAMQEALASAGATPVYQDGIVRIVRLAPQPPAASVASLPSSTAVSVAALPPLEGAVAVRPTSIVPGVGAASSTPVPPPPEPPAAENSPSPPPAPEAPPQPAEQIVRRWEVKAGSTLFATLADWADQVGWTARRRTRGDIPITDDAEITGTFEQAVDALFGSFAAVTPAPTYEAYAGNRRILMLAPGDEVN